MKMYYANLSITFDTTIEKDTFDDLKDFTKEMNIDKIYEIELNILSNLE